MNEYIDSRELQQMKEQLAILTQKLDKETIVNERLMRRAMKEKVTKMQRNALIKGIAIAFGIPYTIGISHMLGVSAWLCAFTILFLAVALVFDYHTHNVLKPREALYGNLMDVQKKALRIKQAYQNWLKVSIPFLIIWCTWFLYELSLQAHIPIEAIITGFVCGGIIGGLIGIKQYNKVQRTADEILEQIEEMQV